MPAAGVFGPTRKISFSRERRLLEERGLVQKVDWHAAVDREREVEPVTLRLVGRRQREHAAHALLAQGDTVILHLH
jgi:hypothetical protein